MNFIKQYYINRKENNIKYLHREADTLKNEIARINNKIMQKYKLFFKIEFEGQILKEQYSIERRLLRQRWIIYNIINKSIKINQRNNLYLTIIYKKLAIIIKEKQILKVLNNRMSNVILDNIFELNSYGIIVARVDKNNIKV